VNEPCALGEVCQMGECVAENPELQCEPRESRCSETGVQMCRPSGEWGRRQDCDTANCWVVDEQAECAEINVRDCGNSSSRCGTNARGNIAFNCTLASPRDRLRTWVLTECGANACVMNLGMASCERGRRP